MMITANAAAFRKVYVYSSLVLLMTLSFSTSLRANGTQGSAWRIVNYWSEWCAPCRVEIPMLNELSELLHPDEVLISGINFDDDPRPVTLEIAARMDIKFSILTSAEISALELRPPDVLPTTYILAPDNSVAAKLIGEQSKEDILEQLEKLGVFLAD